MTTWFDKPGVYSLFDGQYGSSGKGLLAAWLASTYRNEIKAVTTNAGPNSGHTFVWDNDKITLHQLPVSGVVLHNLGRQVPIYLNAGAVIDIDSLKSERSEHQIPFEFLRVHCNAAIIKHRHKDKNTGIASTGQGVGPAMMDKLSRQEEAVFYGQPSTNFKIMAGPIPLNDPILMEVPQGFSLGLNQRFYPHVTTRECTPAQGLLDAGIPFQEHRKSIAAVRTYPIRTGNLGEHSSGPCYDDQIEISWDDLKRLPEISSTSKRQRRVFTWSWNQFGDMLRATRPDALFINFLNYLDGREAQQRFINQVVMEYKIVMGREPDFVLGGYSPRIADIRVERLDDQC